MTIKVTGKNIELGENLRGYVLDRVDGAIVKYSGRSMSGQVSVEKFNDGFATHCAIHLSSGLDMQSRGEGVDAYGSVDAAIERLEKRLRRYNRRLKNHQGGQQASDGASGIDYVINAEEQTGDDEEHAGDLAPAVIAETPARIRSLSVSDAVMQLDLAEQEFLVFRNAAHGRVNVVYRRPDGNIGWIDPGDTLGKQT